MSKSDIEIKKEIIVNEIKYNNVEIESITIGNDSRKIIEELNLTFV